MKVTFTPLGRIGVAQKNETILDVARRAGAPIGNSCGGIGICGRCKITIVEGDVSEPTRFETNGRLACQCLPQGDCSVTTTYW